MNLIESSLHQNLLEISLFLMWTSAETTERQHSYASYKSYCLTKCIHLFSVSHSLQHNHILSYTCLCKRENIESSFLKDGAHNPVGIYVQSVNCSECISKIILRRFVPFIPGYWYIYHKWIVRSLVTVLQYGDCLANIFYFGLAKLVYLQLCCLFSVRERGFFWIEIGRGLKAEGTLARLLKSIVE